MHYVHKIVVKHQNLSSEMYRAAHSRNWHTPHRGTHLRMLCRHTIQWRDSPV